MHSNAGRMSFCMYAAEIEQSPQGEIGALGAVVLIKVQGLVDEERFVIPHPKIDHIVQRVYFQAVRVCVICFIDRIIKLQKVFFIFKDLAEKAVFVFSVDGEMGAGCRILVRYSVVFAFVHSLPPL